MKSRRPEPPETTILQDLHHQYLVVKQIDGGMPSPGKNAYCRAFGDYPTAKAEARKMMDEDALGAREVYVCRVLGSYRTETVWSPVIQPQAQHQDGLDWGGAD